MRLDEFSGYLVGDAFAQRYLLMNEGKFKFYLQRYHPVDRNHLMYEMYERSPLLAMQAVQDHMLSDTEKWKKIMKDLTSAEGLCVCVPGGKRKGKTVTCWYIAERWHKLGRPVYVAGPPQLMPEWAQRITDPAAAPTDCLIYVTEAAIQYSARTSMSPHQRDALSILPSLAHSGRIVLAEFQHTKIVDVNLIRMADRFILKPEPLVGEERGSVKDIFRYLRPKTVKETLYFAGSWFTMITDQPLPECWSQGISKSYRAITSEDEAISYALDLIKLDYSLLDVRRALATRSFIRDTWWWEEKLRPLFFGEGTSPSAEDKLPLPALPSPAPVISSRVSKSIQKIPMGECLPGQEP